MENFQHNFSTGEVEIESSVIYHKTEYRERRNHYAYYSVNTPIMGFDTDRETFFGLYNGFDEPQVVAGGNPTNTVAHGWSPIASHCIEVELQPGESKDFVFVLGYVENAKEEKWESKNIINKTKAKATIARFDTTAKVDIAFAELRAYWDNLLSILSVNSGDDKLDRMVNIWNQYQCMVTFCFSKDPNESFQTTENKTEGTRAESLMIAGLFVVCGRGDQAWDYYKKICPSYLEDISELHKTEPNVYAQMIAGKDSFKPGEAKNSWLTGTASWNFYTISQFILGIQPEYDGLRINPCIPKKWDGFEVTRKFRGQHIKYG